MEGDRVIERVNVTAAVPALGLSDDGASTPSPTRVSPSVVRLRITTAEGDSTACGVVLRDDGNVVTSAHEVAGATAITVVLADGRKVEGEVVGRRPPV